jgi:uncharacterized membrane protein YhaH (DUF805 family)
VETAGATTTDRRIDPIRLFLSSSGRMGRAAFLVAVAALAGVFAVYETFTPAGLHVWTAWAVHLPLLFSAACVLSKRLHDRGRAGWWAAFPVLAFAAAVAGPAPAAIVALAAVVLAWAAVELGALPGQPGHNRFGPPPS